MRDGPHRPRVEPVVRFGEGTPRHRCTARPEATYCIRIVYTGDRFDTRIRLMAERGDAHPWRKKPEPIQAVEFDVPRTATADGVLDLTWAQEPGRGGNGRGCQVAEVWLIRAQHHWLRAAVSP